MKLARLAKADRHFKPSVIAIRSITAEYVHSEPLFQFSIAETARTVQQAEALEGMLTELDVKLDAAICFELPIEAIVARLSGRRTCASCQAVFHVTAQPPRVRDICDHCDGPLIQRRDDHPETIRVRMRAYENETQPLIEYYERSGKLQRIQAAGSPQELLSGTLGVLAEIGIAGECLPA